MLCNNTIVCDCGSIIKKISLARHKKSNKHIKYLNDINSFRKSYFKEYVTCSCGDVLRLQSIYGHRRTNKHKNKIKEIENHEIDFNVEF